MSALTLSVVKRAKSSYGEMTDIQTGNAHNATNKILNFVLNYFEFELKSLCSVKFSLLYSIQRQ